MEGVAEAAAILAGMGVLLIGFAITHAYGRYELATRLDTFVGRHTHVPAPPVKRQHDEPHPAIVMRMNRRLRHASFARRLQWQLIRAGVDMPASRFLVLQGLAAGVGFLLGYVVAGNYLDMNGIDGLGVGALGAVAAGYLPRYGLGFVEQRRLGKFERQLPNLVDAMAGALQAGSSLPQAMEMVSREMPPPIGEEFAVVVRELAVGVPMQEAFDNMLDRVRSLDLDMLVTAINIQYRVGGNLSQILRSIAHTIRERLRIRGEIAVLTAQGRLSAYVVSGLPVFLVGVLFMITPSSISKLFLPSVTRLLLALGIMGIASGFYCMRKITDIDV